MYSSKKMPAIPGYGAGPGRQTRNRGLNGDFILRFSRIGPLFPNQNPEILSIGHESMPLIHRAQR
jgi:hypothetical protein